MGPTNILALAFLVSTFSFRNRHLVLAQMPRAVYCVEYHPQVDLAGIPQHRKMRRMAFILNVILAA